MSAYDYTFSISISEVSTTGFRVNGKIQLGINSYNANGFNVYTSVDGLGTKNHTAVINTKGGSYSFSDYYSVSASEGSRKYTCKVGGDMSWSSQTPTSGNPVITTTTVPAKAYVAHGNPTITVSKTPVHYGESITISWVKSSTQGNAAFKEFRLLRDGKSIYQGTDTSANDNPSAWTGPAGGEETYTIREVHVWNGLEKITEASVTVEVQSGIVSIYDDDENHHVGLVTVYDSEGKGHYVLITAYDSEGSPHNVV